MLKRSIRKLAEKCVDVVDYQSLYKIIQPYEYVSFDIFDTLIKRDVPNPTDIFSVVGSKVNISDFETKRIAAEVAARDKSTVPEITLDDIYGELSYLPNYKLVEKVECETELEECVPNKDIVDFFNFCVKHKHVIIITDMYLPRKIIETILKKNGFKGYDSLIISNEEELVKSDGRLFSKVLKKNNIPHHEMVHIGNSIKADYFGAKKAHIGAVKIPTFKNRSDKKFDYMFGKSEKHNYLMNFINNHITLKSPYYNFGYYSFGPLLYGFTMWLHSELKAGNFDHVLFMARDGYIMKRVYDQTRNSDDIPSQYFEASRRSLRVPTYSSSMDYADMLEVLTVPNLTNPKQILDSWGLDFQRYVGTLRKLGFELTTSLKRDKLLENVRFKKLFDVIKDDIFKNSSDELIALEGYLGQFDFSGKTAIVDIGWGGSMEYSLIKTLNKMHISNNICGFYVGLTQKSLVNLKENGLQAEGYAFDAMNSNDLDMERPFVGLFETLFLEQDGSVKRYREYENSFEAERYPYEYVQDGKVGKEVGYVKDIQQGALVFNRDFSNSCISKYIGFKSNVMFSNLYQVGVTPTLKDVGLFGNFEFFNNGTKVNLANPNSMFYYLEHPNLLRKDMYDSQWKIGFLKKILKLPINYKRVFNLLRKATN